MISYGLKMNLQAAQQLLREASLVRVEGTRMLTDLGYIQDTA